VDQLHRSGEGSCPARTAVLPRAELQMPAPQQRLLAAFSAAEGRAFIKG